MKQDVSSPVECRDPVARLRSALDVIEQFSHHSSPYSRFFEKIRGYVLKTKQFQVDKETLQRAIEDVQRYQPLVLEQSTPESQKLAKRATRIIQCFHQKMPLQRPSSAGRNRIVEVASRVKYQGDMGKDLSVLEKDAFRMKGITLLRAQGASDSLSLLGDAPIYTSCDEAQPIIQLEQTLTPFPGETFILRGAFRRGSDSSRPSIPITERFELDHHVTQTGFPHPSQHAGWALGTELIPQKPFRPEMLKALSVLLKHKESIAEGLSAQTVQLKLAKQLLKEQTQAILNNSEAFLSLHRDLCFAILSAAEGINETEGLNAYFNSIKNDPLQIGKDYEWIHKHCIQAPYAVLWQAWSQQSNSALLSQDPRRALQAADEILMTALEQTFKDDAKRVFLTTMGRVLGAASARIVLQHFSEVMEFTPPELTLFEKKLQTAAYRQLETFFKSLSVAPYEDPFKEVQRRLQKDIEIFCNGRLHPLVGQVERYYSSRGLSSAAG